MARWNIGVASPCDWDPAQAPRRAAHIRADPAPGKARAWLAGLLALIVISVGVYAWLDRSTPDRPGTGLARQGLEPGAGGWPQQTAPTPERKPAPDSDWPQAAAGSRLPERVNLLVPVKCVTVVDAEGNMEGSCKESPPSDPRVRLSPFG